MDDLERDEVLRRAFGFEWGDDPIEDKLRLVGLALGVASNTFKRWAAGTPPKQPMEVAAFMKELADLASGVARRAAERGDVR